VRNTALVVMLLWMICMAVPGIAQVDTGTLVGTITDASGAVVAGAMVTATEIDTATKTSAKTDSDGSFTLRPLKIGRYSVSAEATGFQKEIRQNIVLDVQQTIRLDFKLQVGSVTQTTQVSGEAPLVETETASLGQVVTSRQIEQLPLNGRRYTDLASLTSGVSKVTEGPVNGGSSPTNGNAGGSFSVNGTRGDQNNFILDGVDNNSNDNGDVAQLSSVDAIAEFKVETSNYSSEFGRSGGAVINASTKSGTNQIHGSAWEFLRNDALDARSYFESPDSPKAPYKQNQFGATLGGPIIKEKVFFFVDYEGTRIHSANTDFATVPTALETQGDFSDILGAQVGTDALGRPIYENEIYDPATTQVVGNSTVRNGFGFDPVTGLPIAGQANIIPAGSLNQLGLNYSALYPSVTTAGGNNYRVNAPGTNQADQMDARVDENVSAKIQFFERFSLSQQTRFQAPVFPGIADGGSYNTGTRPLQSRGAVLGYTHVISPNLVNALRFGFSYVHYVSNLPSYGQHFPSSDLQVPGVPNDPSVAGLTWFGFNGYRGLGEPLYTPTKSTSQDTQLNDTLSWVHGKHVIRLGPQFRWDQFNLLQIGQPRGNLQFSGQFTADPNPNDPSAGSTGNSIADMLVGLPISAKVSTVAYFGNRQHVYGAFVEDTYKATRKLTLSLGLRYDYATPVYEAHHRQSNFDYAKGQIIVAGTPGYPENLAETEKTNFAPRIGLAYSPFQSRPMVVRAAYGRFFVNQEIRTGDPLQIDYNLPFFFEPTFTSDGITPSVVNLASGFPPLNPSQAGNAGVTSQDWNPQTAVYDEWNLDIEYQLPGQILITPAYVGTKGTHLQVLEDRNQIPVPSATFDQANRPYPQFGPFTSIENRGNSTYHSFQLKAEKRTTHGLYLLSAFTYSKAIDDQPEICCNAPWPQNSYNLASEKGLSDFDNRERWVTSLDYALPLGKGQRWLSNGKVLDLALGGWHVGGIITLRSGFPFSPEMGFDPSNTGSQGLLRTNAIGNGHLANPSPNLWFNINDFPVPAAGCLCFGNAGKNILEGPGEKTADLSVHKFFNISERVRLEFRGEFFNAFSHPVFSQPDAFITDGAGQAGVITSTVIPQRQIQFALKLEF
jgi:Carboxypeptidase regulatory-like domain/TonB dependent receptor/TonB-dependent Receptor Plug Domain